MCMNPVKSSFIRLATDYASGHAKGNRCLASLEHDGPGRETIEFLPSTLLVKGRNIIFRFYIKHIITILFPLFNEMQKSTLSF